MNFVMRTSGMSATLAWNVQFHIHGGVHGTIGGQRLAHTGLDAAEAPYSLENPYISIRTVVTVPNCSALTDGSRSFKRVTSGHPVRALRSIGCSVLAARAEHVQSSLL